MRFEPDDPDFLRITHRVYEYINQARDYDVLYSSRFFGPMVFYLAWHKKLDHLVAHLLNNRDHLQDSVKVARLHYILHDIEHKIPVQDEQNDYAFLKVRFLIFILIFSCFIQIQITLTKHA